MAAAPLQQLSDENSDGGAMIEVRFAYGAWYRGHLVKRIPGVDPPR
jgi:hypothetical protein